MEWAKSEDNQGTWKVGAVHTGSDSLPEEIGDIGVGQNPEVGEVKDDPER